MEKQAQKVCSFYTILIFLSFFFLLKTYGYEHLLTLHNLEKVGLLKPQTSSRNNYPTIRKTLKLWMEDANEQVKTDKSSFRDFFSSDLSLWQ